MKQDDDKLMKDARALLEHRADDLDDLVVARLRAARLRATEVAGKRQQRFAWLKSAGGLVAASLVIAVAATVWLTNPTAPNNGFDDLEMLVSAESPEFYQDLDFYLWLDEGRTRAG